MKITKLRISSKEFIRRDGSYYNLTDLFRLTTLAGIRLEPWGWAQSENRTRDISRRGWFFKKCWSKPEVLIEYAHYLSPHLYRDVLCALDADDPKKLIDIFGESKASRLDLRVREYIERVEAKAVVARRQNEDAIKLMRRAGVILKADPAVEPFPDLSDTPRFNADDLPKAKPATRSKSGLPDRPELMLRDKKTGRLSSPTRSMSHSRSMGPSVTHHRSEPDYMTQAVIAHSVMNDWDSSSHRNHDSCHTPSHSWSGDSGSSDSGSYDSGGGGCGD